MITSTQFAEQLPQLTEFLQTDKRIQHVIQHNDHLKAAISTSNPPAEIQLLIIYSQSYQSPVLYFRLSILQKEKSNFESWKFISSLSVVQDTLKIRPELHYTMGEANGHGIWWFIHPCDTSLILQNSPDTLFLVNWFSIFGHWVGRSMD